MNISTIQSVDPDLELEICEWNEQATELFRAAFPGADMPTLDNVVKMELGMYEWLMKQGWWLSHAPHSVLVNGHAFLHRGDCTVRVCWSVHTGETEARVVVFVENPCFEILRRIGRDRARRMGFTIDGAYHDGNWLLEHILMGGVPEGIFFGRLRSDQTAGCLSEDCLRKALYVAISKPDGREAYCCDRPDCMERAARIVAGVKEAA